MLKAQSLAYSAVGLKGYEFYHFSRSSTSNFHVFKFQQFGVESYVLLYNPIDEQVVTQLFEGLWFNLFPVFQVGWIVRQHFQTLYLHADVFIEFNFRFFMLRIDIRGTYHPNIYWISSFLQNAQLQLICAILKSV